MFTSYYNSRVLHNMVYDVRIDKQLTAIIDPTCLSVMDIIRTHLILVAVAMCVIFGAFVFDDTFVLTILVCKQQSLFV